MRVTERDLAAAHGRLARRRQGDAKGAAAFLDKRDKQFGQLNALLAQLIEVHVVPDLKRAGKRAQGEDRLCPAQHPPDAVASSEGAIEGKRIRMGPPTAKGLRE